MIEVVPWDNDVHERATIFCRDFLGEALDRSLLRQGWVASDGKRIVGVTGIQSRYDIPIFRSIDPRATFKMADRMNSYFADAGFRGQNVLLFLSQSERPEQQCPARERILEAIGAKPAERYVFTVR
jgi:hypothetical protein